MSTADAPSFLERLRTRSGKDWDAATLHPMTDAFAAGTVPEEALRRYLVQGEARDTRTPSLTVCADSETDASDDATTEG